MAARKTKMSGIVSGVKILLALVIAVALVKIAFFPHTTKAEESTELDPSFTAGQLTVFPTIGSITSDLNLEGTIEPDPAAPVLSDFEGKVSEVRIKDGQAVNQGDVILVLRHEEEVTEDVSTTYESTNDDGEPIMLPTTVSQTRTVVTTKAITAPAAGTLKLQALLNQSFSIGDSIGSVQPPTYSAVAALTPDQMYRVAEVPSSATVTIKNGPAPFECTDLRIVTPQNTTAHNSGNGTDVGAGSSAGSTSIQARCAIPADQRVFAGLQVSVTIAAGQANDVLTLPVSAVEGRFQTGKVYKPADDGGKPTAIDVQLGVTDGKTIQITSGITETDEVLEFVPGTEGEMECNPFTGEGC
ncbi:efflux RND transporter periplasmic adaptor subunit [Arcanobacterium haemolyticum]|nr:efflux RND transporter periplasmic adaptor subunit [Arcanobacterium haemolyticum]